ncbi:MAG: DUF1203 domain-containing protein [Steroidobacter sp.]
MSFRITGLPLHQFESLFSLSNEQLAERNAVRVVANKRPGYPCRVSLQDAELGESLILLNYEHLPVASPYRSVHAVYVREAATEAALAVDEVPVSFRHRLLSLRAYDAKGMMQSADVTPGTAVETMIEQMFADPTVEYLHVHNAKPGCYAARVDRA